MLSPEHQLSGCIEASYNRTSTIIRVVQYGEERIT